MAIQVQLKTTGVDTVPEPSELEEDGFIKEAKDQVRREVDPRRLKALQYIDGLRRYRGYRIDRTSIEIWNKVLATKSLKKRFKEDVLIQQAVEEVFRELRFDFCFKDSKPSGKGEGQQSEA